MNRTTKAEKGQYVILTERDFRILYMLNKYRTLKELSVILKIPKSTLSDRFSILKRLRMVRSRGKTINTTFELLPKGINIIKGFLEGGYKPPLKLFRLHGLRLTMRHNSSPLSKKQITEERGYITYPRNQHEKHKNFRGRLFDCVYIVTPSMVILDLPDIWSVTPEEGYAEVMRKVNEVKAELESRFDGLEIGEANRLARLDCQHIAMIGNPVSIELSKFNRGRGEKMIYRGTNLHCDFSTELPEIETTNKVTAPEDMERLIRAMEFIAVGSITIEQLINASRYLESSGLGYLAPVGSLNNGNT